LREGLRIPEPYRPGCAIISKVFNHKSGDSSGKADFDAYLSHGLHRHIRVLPQ
jgi:hypothetical protein